MSGAKGYEHYPLQQDDVEEGLYEYNSKEPTMQLDGLQFMTSIDRTVDQSAPLPPVKRSASDSVENHLINDERDSSILGLVFRSSSHPFACIAHCFFKAAAILLYLFGGLLSKGVGSNFIVVNVVTICLLAVDSYVTQKISGRLLVGLRWHNIVEPDGQSTKWIFESKEDRIKINPFDRAVFWSVLYANPAVWISFFLLSVMKLNFSWLIPCAVAITLSGANVYGYWQCSNEQKAKFKQIMRQGTEAGARHAFANSTAIGGMINKFSASFS